ncbi:hypothetical protein B0H10DRAFT_2196842 [Mycena sp. CBHHK59/15]|nr:hypothetical protein B0H10DRAFT_2196842 [Mycena sp. CBHHK59/15]
MSHADVHTTKMSSKSDTGSTSGESISCSAKESEIESDHEGLTALADKERVLEAHAQSVRKVHQERYEARLRDADDVRCMLENIYIQLDTLTGRTGVRTLLLSARGHFGDLVEPRIHASGDGMDFIRAVFHMDATELGLRMDAWAVTKAKNSQCSRYGGL